MSRPQPYSAGDEAALRSLMAQRHPAGPGLTAEGVARLLATLDRDRRFIARAANAMREIAIELAGDFDNPEPYLMAIDMDDLVRQSRDPHAMMDTRDLARAAVLAVEKGRTK